MNALFIDFAEKPEHSLCGCYRRYLFLNAIANQLRYPNNHTHYFSCVLLFLFAEATQEIVQEQITRVLLERLIVNRPHPWGLLITFIELIKVRARSRGHCPVSSVVCRLMSYCMCHRIPGTTSGATTLRGVLLKLNGYSKVWPVRAWGHLRSRRKRNWCLWVRQEHDKSNWAARSSE
eukprot:scaffold442_cov397-Prasinococcus_capsulatus_cf.AAC.12